VNTVHSINLIKLHYFILCYTRFS